MQNIVTTNPHNDIIPDNYIAALDIGSNSFHFAYARVIDQHLQILHTEKYRVRLANGLDGENNLSLDAIARGVATLENLAATVKNLSATNFRVVATYTLRQAKNYQVFLDAAAKIFPFDIEVISGHEEARLIYQGVARYCQPTEQRLVLDIGGGSTECVIGKHYQTKALASLTMGCVSFTQQYFANKAISQKQFNQAIKAAKHQINSIAKRFKKTNWQTATGTSGTIKTIHQLINRQLIKKVQTNVQAKLSDSKKATNKQTIIEQPITLKLLYKLQQQLIDFEHVDKIHLASLKENRQEVICAGLAILIALMEVLAIETLHYCSYALREGVLFEQWEQLNNTEKNTRHQNVRQNTITRLSERFNIDNEQSVSVEQLALALYQGCAQAWNINEKCYSNLLSWAASLHEIGLDINPSSYHKHGQYIIEHSDLAGFNQEQQHALAWLIGNHRKKLTAYKIINNYQVKNKALTKVAILLRIAVLLNQQRQLSNTPTPSVMATAQSIQLVFNKQWLIERPIVDSDLFFEQHTLESIGMSLIIKSM